MLFIQIIILFTLKEETIIFALIERAQYRRNYDIYDPKKVKLRNMIPLSRKETGKGASMQSAFKNALAAKFSHLRRDSTSSVKDDEDAEEWL